MSETLLKNVAEISSGRGFKEGVKPSNQGVYVLTVADVSGDTKKINWQEVKKSDITLRSHKSLHNGEIVFLAKGKLNKARVVSGLDGVAVATHHFFVINPVNTVDSYYLAMKLNSEEALKYFFDNARGGAKQHITKSALGQFKLSIPPIEEQRLIVQMIEQVDNQVIHVQNYRSLFRKACNFLIEGKLDESERILIEMRDAYDSEFHTDIEQFYALLRRKKLESADEVKGKRKLNRI
ncbi:MAG TPA: hypothetical protein ENI26_13110 [Methylophaga aminisulfidivorans]|uniref:Type I restriction modification DNA specificity domain-containing protein n=1 Tax=Methylophaga aminisulfidivorans TaxID=230105 RepID=A0A7C1ZVI9_9GAMM|nr:hypothetical protein [Methylophaga aminisulfidivorans]